MLVLFSIVMGVLIWGGGSYYILHMSSHARNHFCHRSLCKRNWIKR